MGSGVKVWTINSLADEIIRGILKGSVVDVVSKERISKRFGAISRVIVAHKKTLRISESQASMFGFGEIFRKMENLRKILFCGPEEGCEPVNLGRQLAHLNPNIVSIRDVNSSESLVRHSRDTVPIVMEYVLASYNNDKSYTGSNLEIEFPQSMADLLTRQCPGLNLKTDVWWSEAAADEMATCRWLHLEGPDGGVVENGTYPSVKIISIDGTFSHLESLRSFPNLEVLCLYGHGDGLVDLHQFLPSTIKKLELFFEEISDRHVSLLNSLLDNFNLTSVYLHVVNSCNNEKQEFQKILYTLIRTRNQSPRTFAIKRVFKMSGRNMRIKISPVYILSSKIRD